MRLKPGEAQLNIAIDGSIYKLFRQFCLHREISYKQGILLALKLWIKTQQEMLVSEQNRLNDNYNKSVENAKKVIKSDSFDQHQAKETQTV